VEAPTKSHTQYIHGTVEAGPDLECWFSAADARNFQRKSILYGDTDKIGTHVKICKRLFKG
jgi:hypothetical protein